jgi:hypothetical protein
MGAASEGGYLGSDSAAFSTAIRSGAAGFYIFSQAAADVSCVATLTIRADQDVKMSTTNLEAVWRHSSVAVANTLGVNSAMEVLARATLTISGIAVEGQLAVLGGELYVSNCDFDDTKLHYTAPQDQTCCPDRANGWAGIAIDVQAGSASIRSSRFHGIGASAPFTIHYIDGRDIQQHPNAPVSVGSGGSLTIVDTEFSGNAAQGDAAAIYVFDGGSIAVDGCAFTGNTGAGTSIGTTLRIENGASVSIRNSEFSGNSGGHDAGWTDVAMLMHRGGNGGHSHQDVDAKWTDAQIMGAQPLAVDDVDFG